MPAIESTTFTELEQTALLLASGFESLLAEVESLAHREHYLKSRLDFAHDEYRKLALNPTLIVSNSTNRRNVLRKFKVNGESPARLERSTVSLDRVAERYDLKEALEACRSLKRTGRAFQSDARPDAVPEGALVEGREDFEYDFTTRNGKPSKLECPFARMGNGNGNHPRIGADPIAAEFHGEGSVVSGTAYANQNPNKCPIRYLDQHSPEEVAKYFENHKHEVPRSHAVCVSRYQQNDVKIRQLDAKYGNLQNMIQSLGVKHQQYLPGKEGDLEVQRPSSPPAAVSVEKWAENVSRRSSDHAALNVAPKQNSEADAEQEDVNQHFENPLREIRLGESPSRPWGIAVPIAQETAASAIPSDKGIEPLSLDGPEGEGDAGADGQVKQKKPVGKCPFDSGVRRRARLNGASAEKDPNVGEVQVEHPAPHPQMVFNGPVFFGYSPEQATALMQSGTFARCKT